MCSNELQADTERTQVQEARARYYAILSRLFSDQSTGADLEGYLDYLKAWAGIDDSPAAFFSGRLEQWLKAKDSDHLLKTEYARLFIMPGGIRPYESVYRGEAPLLMQDPWLKVKQFYRQCGLKLESPAGHLEDHASAEFAFMLYLIEDGGRKAEEETFFSRHLECWVPLMLEDLIQHRHARFFKDAALFCRAFLESERVYFRGDIKEAQITPDQLQGSDKRDEDRRI